MSGVLDGIGVDTETMNWKQKRVAIFGRKDRIEVGVASGRRRHIFMRRPIYVGKRRAATSAAGIGMTVRHEHTLKVEFRMNTSGLMTASIQTYHKQKGRPQATFV